MMHTKPVVCVSKQLKPLSSPRGGSCLLFPAGDIRLTSKKKRRKRKETRDGAVLEQRLLLPYRARILRGALRRDLKDVGVNDVCPSRHSRLVLSSASAAGAGVKKDDPHDRREVVPPAVVQSTATVNSAAGSNLHF
jgi:hypothetical protein